MRFLACFCVAVFVLIGSASSQQEAELVKKVKAKLDRVRDYTAQGKMKIDVSFIDAPDSKVTVYYQRPDKFKVKKDGGISILEQHYEKVSSPNGTCPDFLDRCPRTNAAGTGNPAESR